jgi:hypothetical protein
MNEIQAIQAQIGALLKARKYLLNQTPSDMVALADVTERIIDLNRRQAAISGVVTQLAQANVDSLEEAIQDLDDDINDSVSASNILDGVAKVVGAA